MILISPWARNTTDGKPSPKNYPHWEEVVRLLHEEGYKGQVVQVSCAGEPEIPGRDVFAGDFPLSEIEDMLRHCKAWISVDNFFHHLAWSVGKPGVVLWGVSDPLIFGHPENTNLLKSRGFLRKRQFGLWSQESPNPDAFVSPEEVIVKIRYFFKEAQHGA